MTAYANDGNGTRPPTPGPHHRSMRHGTSALAFLLPCLLACLLATPLGAAAHPGHAPVQGVLDTLLHQPWTLGALLLAGVIGGGALLRRVRDRR